MNVLSEDSRRAAEAFADHPLPGAVPVEQLRASMPRLMEVLAEPGPQLARVRDDVAAGEAPVPVRIYVPAQDCSDVLVYAHGGGWVAGSIDTHDRMVRRLALAVGCTVVSVEYRLAPEHPFPAGLEDVMAVLERARDLVEANGVRTSGALAVGGDSAGGNLAAAAAIAARERGLPLGLQVLINPVLREHRVAPARAISPGDFPEMMEILHWEWDQYVPARTDEPDPLAAPDALADLRGLAPAAIVTAEHDYLTHEARDYAHRLEAAGVPIWLHEVPGAIHGFLEHTRMGDQADRELERLAGAIRRLWPAGGASSSCA
ncbi:MAG TPA: alpha/beta hydrolase [Conexibacter sp.]|jgi:acetyl esterase|nr:alpha/beta hydrolase [Conexibacter sp.]